MYITRTVVGHFVKRHEATEGLEFEVAILYWGQDKPTPAEIRAETTPYRAPKDKNTRKHYEIGFFELYGA